MGKTTRSWNGFFRRFRVWHKKRGGRSSGSRLLGGAGEAAFYAILFLIATTSLAQLVIYRLQGVAELTLPHFLLWMLAVSSLVVTSASGFFFSVSRIATSDERRMALANRAKNIELLPQSHYKGLPAIPSADNLTNSPGVALDYRLPVSEMSIWRLSLSAAFCLICNGVNCWVVALLVHQLRTAQLDYSLATLSVPLIVAGTVSIHHLTRQLMMATAIGPTSIEISEHPLQVGGSCEIQLTQTGNTKLKTLEVLLVCEEEATYTQGTDTRLERRRVYEMVVIRDEDFHVAAGETYERRCELTIPPTAMHSFQAEHNCISWKLVVRGVAGRWPAFQRVFPLVVHPQVTDVNAFEGNRTKQALIVTENL